jgi:uncharacterized protein (TIGR02391 family)
MSLTIDRHRLRGAFARLKGIQQTAHGGTQPGTLGKDFNKIVSDLGEILGEPTSDFILPQSAFFGDNGRGTNYCNEPELKSKLNQLIQYLEYTQHVGSGIIEIGSLFNSIQDEALKARCADLLSAPGNFDRVINQATQVLEDRIRKKAGEAAGSLVGAPLVNQVVKGDPRATVLKFSDDRNEQEGYANILRGIVGAYRNPTHHHVLDHITREDALKVCAFIDGLLKVVDSSTVNKTSP